mgnify:FL=1
MMKLIFYILSLVPRTFFIVLVDIYISTRIYKLLKSYKITKINIKIAYPDLNIFNVELLSKLSIREMIISGYETIYCWGRSPSSNNSMVFKVENNFLFKSLINKKQGLISVAFHNRSVDMLITWINTQTPTVSLYKKIKNKYLNSFVQNKRQINHSLSVETSISGVRKIYKALKDNNVVCFAADQVPQRGMGEYIKFYNRDAYSTTLVQSLAKKTMAPVVYLYLKSNKDNFLSICIKHCSNNIYDDSKHTLLINNDIEKMINERPIDYSWEYKRFKKSQTGVSDPYKTI